MRHYARYAGPLRSVRLLAVLALVACADGALEQGAADTMHAGPGSVQLRLETDQGTSIRSVGYLVTGADGEIALQDLAPLDAPHARPLLRLTLGVAAGYTVRVTATATDGTQCTGATAFDVLADSEREVLVDLRCAAGRDAVGAAGGTRCPDISLIEATPLEASLGGRIDLRARTTRHASTVRARWTASRGALVSDSQLDTTFVCTTPGLAVLTLAVREEPDCLAEQSVEVRCVAPGASSVADGSSSATTSATPGTPAPMVSEGVDPRATSPASVAPPAQVARGLTQPQQVARRAVTIRFRATVSGSAFACGQRYAGQGSTAVTATPTDFRFFVSELRLIDSAGAEVPVQLTVRPPWQSAEVALIDFEDGQGRCYSGNAETNVEIHGTVPAGHYGGVVFSNSIPMALNHGDPAAAPAPLSRTPGVLWSWLSGYKFIMAELARDDPQGVGGVGLTHVGSTACTGSPRDGAAVRCSRPNRNQIRLGSFDPDTQVIVADLGHIFADTDLTQDVQCHSSGASCAPSFARMGIDYASGQAGVSQQMYHIE